MSLRPLNLILRDNKYSTLFPGFSPTCPTEPLGTRLIIIKCALSVVIKCVNILQHLVFLVCITISLYAALSYSFLNTRVRRKSAINTPNRDNKCPRLFHMGVTPPPPSPNCRPLPGKIWFWKGGCLSEFVAQGVSSVHVRSWFKF